MSTQNDDHLTSTNGAVHAIDGEAIPDTRLNGSEHANVNDSAKEDDPPRLKNPIHAERHMRVVCVGAGASGLLIAYKLQRSFNNFNVVLYEKNDNVSGTWYENKYPG